MRCFMDAVRVCEAAGDKSTAILAVHVFVYRNWELELNGNG